MLYGSSVLEHAFLNEQMMCLPCFFYYDALPA